MTSRAQFKVVFDGPALASHEMDVADLAESLLALGGLIGSAGEIAFEGKVKSSVKVRALNEGSLGIELALDHGFFSGIAGLLHGDQTPQILLDHLGLSLPVGLPGLVEVLKFLAGREPDSVEPTDKGTFNLNINVNGNNNHIEVSSIVETLRKSPNVRKKLEEFVSPVSKEGIDEVKFYGVKGEGPSIGKREAEFFRAPTPPESVLMDTTERVNCAIVKPSFEPGYKWTFRKQNLLIQASIKDEVFNGRVSGKMETFSSGDFLDCDLRTVQEEKPGGGIVTTYEVLKVHDHTHSRKDQSLPFKNPQ